MLNETQFNGQLQMFMPAKDIRSNYETWPGDRAPLYGAPAGAPLSHRQSDSRTYDLKYYEGSEDMGHAVTQHEHLRRVGITHPIPLGNGVLAGGMHRVAWAAKEAPDMEVPVVHIASDVKGATGWEYAGPTEARQQMKPFGGYR